ncbi:polysaccharide deacetylase family protein [Ammoniphilus sp. 3BR4]|uniref:polysaccharide deacetylase family protein n=1 Tax=Ammoniphilus sp. 3BR4 TaxID=3158265 RepID=UPI0034656360
MKRIGLLFFLMVVILQACNGDRADQKIQKEKKQVQKSKEEKTKEIKYTREELRQGIEKLARDYGLSVEEKNNEGSYSSEELEKNIEELADEYNRSSKDPQVEEEPSVEQKEFAEKLRKLAQRYNLEWNESPKQGEASSPMVEQNQNHEVSQKNKNLEKKVKERPQPHPLNQRNTSSQKTIEKKANEAERGNHKKEELQTERIARGGSTEEEAKEPTKLKQPVPEVTHPQPTEPPTVIEGAPKLADSETKDENLLDNIYHIAPKKKEQDDGKREYKNDSILLDLSNVEPRIRQDRRKNTTLTFTELKKKYPKSFFTRGEQGKERIALTFDDGPDLTYTPQILNILRESDVNATFFLIGERAEAHPHIVKQIIQEGHEVGIHSYKHLYLPKLDESSFEQQIQRMEGILRSLGADTKLFRPPFGSINDRQAEFVIQKGYKIVHWDVDSQDWKGGLNKKKIADNVLGFVHPSSIILFHSAGGIGIELSGTVEALPQIIEQLKEKDMTFVKVSELLK